MHRPTASSEITASLKFAPPTPINHCSPVILSPSPHPLIQCPPPIPGPQLSALYNSPPLCSASSSITASHQQFPAPIKKSPYNSLRPHHLLAPTPTAVPPDSGGGGSRLCPCPHSTHRGEQRGGEWAVTHARAAVPWCDCHRVVLSPTLPHTPREEAVEGGGTHVAMKGSGAHSRMGLTPCDTPRCPHVAVPQVR